MFTRTVILFAKNIRNIPTTRSSINTQLLKTSFFGTSKKTFSNTPSTLEDIDFKKLGIPKTVNGILINLSGLGKYATLLYTEAAKKNEIEKREQELTKLHELLKTHEKFINYIKSPVITRKQKALFIKELLQKYFSPELVDFLQYLANAGRLPQLSEIINIFHTRVMPLHRNEANALITSATPLTPNELKYLSLCLKMPSWSRGQDITIKQIVDPSILGGFIVELGTRRLDLSVQSKLKQYDNAIQEAKSSTRAKH